MKKEQAIKECETLKRCLMQYSDEPNNIKSRQAIETVLNMLKEKDALYHKALGELVKADRENMKKDKIIDLMADYIDKLSEYYTKIEGKNNDFCDEKCIDKNIDCYDCIKQYFERKVIKC